MITGYITHKVVDLAIGKLWSKIVSDPARQHTLTRYRTAIAESLKRMDEGKIISRYTQSNVAHILKLIIDLEAEVSSASSENVAVLVRKIDEIARYPKVMRESDCRSCRGAGGFVCPECNGDGSTALPDYDATCRNCEGCGNVMCDACRNGGQGHLPVIYPE